MPIYLYPVIFARCNDNRKAKKRAFVSYCVSDVPKGKKYKYGAQNEVYMSRLAEKVVSGLCFNELGSDA